MPRFQYTALDSAGREVSGQLVAETRGAALDQISDRALHPVAVTATESSSRKAGLALGRGRVSKRDVDAFTRGLANLLAAGVPLNRALRILSEDTAGAAAARRWEAVREEVEEGTPLADALGQYPRCFPAIYVAMVRAGETGGFLDTVLEQIADFRQQERDLKGRVTAALIYPAVLAGLAVPVMGFLLAYFVPRFAAVFAEFGGNLPWLTRAVRGISEFLVAHGLAILLGVVLIVVAGQRMLASESGRRFVERAVLKVPALGQVIARFALVRFCRMLGTLLAAGVPLLTALRAAKEAVGNQTLADTVNSAVQRVQQGEPLARSLAGNGQLFPASVVEMVAVAEETSRLDHELVRLADSFEAELDRRLRMLVALAEPALLFIMAGLIGTVVISMLLPVFTLQDLIR